MKVFVSSVISGFEPIRSAARAAIEDLGHEPVMAEDFVPGPRSPQVACLSGVREAAVVLLILGAEYGERQVSGYSATDEEFRAARETRPVIAFVQNVSRTAEQEAFASQVEGLTGGYFRGSFDGPAALRRKIVRALHEWEISNASGPVDNTALAAAALRMIPPSDRNYSIGSGPSVVLAVASGPPQAILRPSEVESSTLRDKLLKEALFGQSRIFDSAVGSEARLHGSSLVLAQTRGAELVLDPQGGIRVKMPVADPNDGRFGVSAIIEEDIREMLLKGIGFTQWTLNEIDPTQRLTHSAPAVAIQDAQVYSWRTRQHHAANRDRATMRMGNDDPRPVTLSPAVRPRTALRFDIDRIVDDLITLLARSYRTD